MKLELRRTAARYPGALALLAAVVLATSASAATTTSVAAGMARPGAAVSKRVTLTLITGDVVSYATSPGGRQSVGLVSGSHSIRILGDGKHLYAIPSSAAAGFWGGTLDKELFDVKYLADNGYGDAQTGTLPVILQYPSGTDPAMVAHDADALPGSDVTASLPSVRGAGVGVKKGQAKAFWRSVGDDTSTAPAPHAQGSATLGDGLRKIWLDRKVKVADDVSNAQIGAPTAWAAGYDGSGVKVAVLDTGIDLTHPDLQGKVVDSKVFTGEASVQDGFGHGTHVASIIAGSGAASGGQYKGVAPGAQLLIGKVLSNLGSGTDSEVIAGMQWAAAEGARVVNMSLGSSPTDGTDPVSEAVDDLTASTGTLFVIAAGNGGPDPETVTAPGAADAALTVAAVDRNDQIASFSSRGPRIGDGALKPDIAAPGVDIVAARASGTSLGRPVGTYYTTLSGTSMATPHVAGSAAILAEEHQSWNAAQLKAALMSSAKDLGDSPYEQGAGRVDIGRAATQQVFASTTSLDFGSLPFPQGAPIAKSVTYTNYGSGPVTLTLTTTLRGPDGLPAPDGMLAPQSPTVNVPAGGSATATVVLDPTKGVAGTYTGSVGATAGGVEVTTPVTATKQPQLFTLTLHSLDRTGEPVALGIVEVNGIDHPEVNMSFLTGATTLPLRLPAGSYSISSDQLPNSAFAWDDILRINPQFELTSDGDLTFDSRRATEARIDPPRAGDLHNTVYAYHRVLPDGQEITFGTATGHSYFPERFFVTPTSPVTQGSFRYDFFQAYGPDPVTMNVAGRASLTLHPTYELGYQPVEAMFQGKQTVPVVYAGQGSASDLAGLDLNGKLALLQITDPNALCPSEAVLSAIGGLGAVGVVAFHSQFPYGLGTCFGTTDTPAVGLPRAEGQALLALVQRRPTMVKIDGTGASAPYVYNLDFGERGQIPARLVHEVGPNDVGAVDLRVHAARPGFDEEWPFTYQPDEDFSARVAFVLRAPHAVREYFGPISPTTVWERVSANDAYPTLADELLGVFPSATVAKENIDDGPFVPGAPLIADVQTVQPRFTILCAGCREGDSFTPLFPTTTGEPSDSLSLQLGADVHLFRDGQELPNVGDPVFGFLPSFDLPPGGGNYRLTQDYDVPVDGQPQAQHVRTEWTYSSLGTSQPGQTTAGYYCLLEAAFDNPDLPCRPEPLVLLRYDLGLDLDNAQPAPGARHVTITAYHQPGGPPTPDVTGLSLSVSYDDGAHWRSVETVPKGSGRFAATITYPAPGATGFVSLRTEAWDADGNRVVQTIEDAFGLKAR